jgi:hypothetical protein
MQGRLNDWLVSVMGLVPRLYWIIWVGCGTILVIFLFIFLWKSQIFVALFYIYTSLISTLNFVVLSYFLLVNDFTLLSIFWTDQIVC